MMKRPLSLIGVSDALREVRRLIRRVAAFENTVLIRGPSGSGKELAARWIHYLSRRRENPFVAINAGAFPEKLIESEIFGYEKGAFTGAESRKPGKIETAEGGSFFLDEIGDLPLPLQVKLLRVLQEKTFERLGGVTPLDADVRFIAATHRDLEEMISEGLFREDLYYRLNVITINIPPLKERPEDIPYLARFIIRQELGTIPEIDEELMATLQSFEWHGNIRELYNNIQRILVFYPGEGPLRLKDVRDHIRPMGFLPGQRDSELYTLPFKEAQQEFKKRYIRFRLEKNRWMQRKTAREMGIQPSYLSRLIKELGLGKKKEKP
ncbi:MAG TPA: sigma-54 dependent transcriptional regulator [Candidatus Mcinerneyibacteriales bacterium]|nr:sigma-54-dependent Fis family transcriptional regulator [Candidatus Mcinerneyibacteriota bacterium]HOO60540.1 sigma-54 dependent transcriptional regulator [Candidatus Mcinerneyibacteriales bacterium]HPJ70672.1 sigma-54 dependent transcriptional regulator [Candidatus Mcinerneyibacteriales bacterium]